MLPDDIINEIISYGDVNVTQKYKGVIIQLNYYKKEFDYQRKSHKNGYWYGVSGDHYNLYILYKSLDKYHDIEMSRNLIMRIHMARNKTNLYDIIYEIFNF